MSNLPIRIETARYERPKIDPNLRFCLIGCESFCVEDEYHRLFSCKMYNNMRFPWLSKIEKPENFQNLTPIQKLKIVLDSPLNVKITAKFLVDICNVHSKISLKNDDSVKEAPAYCRSFLDGLNRLKGRPKTLYFNVLKCFVTFCKVL